MPRIAPLDVVTLNDPRTLSSVTPPFDVRTVTPPSTVCTSTAPFEVRASTRPLMLRKRMAPFDVFRSLAGPSTSSMRNDPLDDWMRTNSVRRGTRMMYFAPPFQRRGSGRLVRTCTVLPLWVASTRMARSMLSSSAYLVPETSTVFWSQPRISTEPLKFSKSSRPPAPCWNE